MKETELQIKLSYISGLGNVVIEELKRFNFQIIGKAEDSVFIECSAEALADIVQLRSVARAYLVLRGKTCHTAYISNHKSVLGNLIEAIIKNNKNEKKFKTFKIHCAGSESLEVKSISAYIHETFNLDEKDEADLKIHIIKQGGLWEIGIQITPRPLSVRDYKIENMSGAMDSTIAYAVNSFCHLETAASYLNIFSGSATLLIEAGQTYKNISKIVGFDNDKKHLSLSIKNIQKAGLIKNVHVKEADIFDMPDFGMFDAIVSDLPFGMVISKKEDLKKLYTAFIEYCEEVLNTQGRLVVYTSEYKLIESILRQSKFKIIQSLQLKFITNARTYLRPKILVCEFK